MHRRIAPWSTSPVQGLATARIYSHPNSYPTPSRRSLFPTWLSAPALGISTADRTGTQVQRLEFYRQKRCEAGRLEMRRIGAARPVCASVRSRLCLTSDTLSAQARDGEVTRSSIAVPVFLRETFRLGKTQKHEATRKKALTH